MRTHLSTVLLIALLAGCSSLDGQVGENRDVFVRGGKFKEAAAIPRATQQDVANPVSGSRTSAYVPLLGRVGVGKDSLGASLRSRSFGYWGDPSDWYESQPTLNELPGVTPGGFIADSASLSKSFDASVSVQAVKLKIGTISLDAAASSGLSVRNTHWIELDMADFDLLSQLADAKVQNDSSQVFFVSRLLVGDPLDTATLEAKADFIPPAAGAVTKVQLAAHYRSEYSGIGLVLGIGLSEISNGAKVSLPPALIPQIERVGWLGAGGLGMLSGPQKTAIQQFGEEYRKVFSADPPKVAYRCERVTGQNQVRVTFIRPPSMSNPRERVTTSGGTTVSTSSGVVLDVSSQHDFDVRYLAVSGTEIYTCGIQIHVDPSTFAVTENADRSTSLVKFRGVQPSSLVPKPN